jgi:hypothetical protein
MSRKRASDEGATEEAVEVAPPPLSLEQALGVSLNLVGQGWTPVLSPDGAVIGAVGDDGTKMHLRADHSEAVVLEFVK